MLSMEYICTNNLTSFPNKTKAKQGKRKDEAAKE